MNSKIKWLYLSIGTLLLMLVGLIYAWSIFRGPLSELFPEWTATQISTTFMISMIAFCSFGLFSGKLSQRIKPSIIIRMAAILLFVGFATITLLLNEDYSSKSLVIMHFFYGILCGGGVGFTYNSVIGTVTKWFPNDTGMASGTLLMGFGIGGLVLGSLVNGLAEAVGIKTTFIILGGIIAVILLAGSFFIKNPPWWDNSEEDSSEDVSSDESVSIESVRSYTFSETIKKPSAWVFFLCITALGTGCLIVMNSAAVIAVYFGAPAVVGLIVSVFNGAGRVIVGKAYDVLGRIFSVNATCLLLITSGVILLIGSLLNSLVFIIIGLIVLGLAFGGTPAIVAGVTHEFFGPKYFPVNYSFMTFNLAPSAFLGPIISSKLQDYSNGSYTSTFVMIIAMGLLAWVSGFCLEKIAVRDGLIKGKVDE